MTYLRTTLALIALAAMSGGCLRGDARDEKLRDSPKQLEGTIKRITGEGPEGIHLTIAVREQQPTDTEDVLAEVDKDYRFRITESTRIFGIDGRVAKQGHEVLKMGDRVRVESVETVAVDVRILPPK